MAVGCGGMLPIGPEKPPIGPEFSLKIWGLSLSQIFNSVVNSFLTFWAPGPRGPGDPKTFWALGRKAQMTSVNGQRCRNSRDSKEIYRDFRDPEKTPFIITPFSVPHSSGHSQDKWSILVLRGLNPVRNKGILTKMVVSTILDHYGPVDIPALLRSLLSSR